MAAVCIAMLGAIADTASAQDLPKVPAGTSVPVSSSRAEQSVGVDGKPTPVNVFCGESGSLAPAKDSIWVQVLDDFIKLMTGVAWPATVLLIAVMFRRQIAEKLSHVRRGKFGSAEIEFNEDVRTAEEEAGIPDTPQQVIDLSTIAQITRDPRGAILEAWVQVEAALFQLLEARKLAEGYTRIAKRPLTAIRLVQQHQLLSANYVGLFHDLRTMRNEAAHNQDFSPPAEAVGRYVRLAKELTAELRKRAA